MKVCANNVLSHLITDETGVNQGGPNSPDMFVDFLSDLRKYLDEQCVIVVDECVFLHLLWADDLIIGSNSASGLQKSLDNLFHYSTQWQLLLNVTKTQVFVCGTASFILKRS